MQPAPLVLHARAHQQACGYVLELDGLLHHQAPETHLLP